MEELGRNPGDLEGIIRSVTSEEVASQLSYGAGEFFGLPDAVNNVKNKLGSVANNYITGKVKGFLGGNKDTEGS